MRTRLSAFVLRQRRRWPPLWRGLHLVGWLGSGLAVLTGVLIVWPYAHAHLIAYLLALRWVHTALGSLVAAALGCGAGLRFPHRRNRLDWVPVSVLLGVLTMSGVLLLDPNAFPSTWTAPALAVHLWATWALVAFAAFHVVRKLHLVRTREAPYLEERRGFLRSAGTAFGLGALATVFGPSFWSWLAPGASTGTWQIYSITGTYPNIPLSRYRLRVEGMVRQPLELTFADLERLPRTTLRKDFHCVTGWVVQGVLWEGVAVQHLLEVAGPQPGAAFVSFYSADGEYMDGLSFWEVTRTGALLAYAMDGAPVSVAHGGPVRLFVPGMYGYKSVKWVDRVVVGSVPPFGTWEQYGYPPDAWIQA